MDDWHWCDGSTASAAKSNNQWGAKKANVVAKRQMGRQKANGAPKGKWGNGVSLWERQCTQDKAMKPIESGNEPVALSQMKGNELAAMTPIERQLTRGIEAN